MIRSISGESAAIADTEDKSPISRTGKRFKRCMVIRIVLLVSVFILKMRRKHLRSLPTDSGEAGPPSVGQKLASFRWRSGVTVGRLGSRLPLQTCSGARSSILRASKIILL